MRLRRELRTKGGAIFGAGTTMVITRKYKGVEIEQVSICEACGCGARRSIARVDFSDLELLPEVKA